MLPEPFVQRIRAQLTTETDEFFAALDGTAIRGLRLNPFKTSALPWDLEPIPWVSEGFFVSFDIPAGIHPLQDAGVYYIQDPSAMAAVEALDVQPGMTVLDVCAAPGGKGSMIAGRVGNDGLAILNDPVRAKQITATVERLGLPNAQVTQATPAQLAAQWPRTFERVLVDAPCSGEGMFRKDPKTRNEWKPESPARCAIRQAGVLEAAAQTVCAGGRLVYSTCTFSYEENEAVVTDFLRRNHDWRLVPAFEEIAYSEWGFERTLEYATRLWPHRVRGEGHFIAALQYEGSERNIAPRRQYSNPPAIFRDWAQDVLTHTPQGIWQNRDGRWFLLPTETCLNTLPVMMGEERGKRWVPAHGLAMRADADCMRQLVLEPAQADAYLHGLVLPPAFDGWGTVGVGSPHRPLGWVKGGADGLKNHLPSGLRHK